MKSDRQLQHDVMAELGWEPSVDASRIGVESKDGIITLSGHVDSYAEKWAAERVAQRVSGVKGVAVEIEVALPGSSQRTDGDIAKAASNALEWNASVPRNAVKVKIENGWITLSGEVEWAFERSAAEASVRWLIGVRGVVNDIAIRPRAKPVDIKTKIEAALQRRAYVDANAITIAVDKGTVTLSGRVDSWSEHDTIEHAAWKAPGVTQVVDKLVVTA